MSNITINNDDVELIKKFKQIRDKGYYISGDEVTKVYNRVFNMHVETTNCSSCIRRRVSELIHVADTFTKQLELNKKEEEKVEEPVNEEEQVVEEQPKKKRTVRKKK